jgi:hypothetical protein
MTTAGLTGPLLFPGEPDEDLVAEARVLLPPFNRQHLRLAFAGFAPSQIEDANLKAAGAEPSLLLYEAYASAVVCLEALKQAGRRLDRAALIEALEALHDVRTGTLPPITFGPNRHAGLSGAAVIGFTADGHAIFLAPWKPAE